LGILTVTSRNTHVFRAAYVAILGLMRLEALSLCVRWRTELYLDWP
jgi:hypothetical protein